MSAAQRPPQTDVPAEHDEQRPRAPRVGAPHGDADLPGEHEPVVARPGLWSRMVRWLPFVQAPEPEPVRRPAAERPPIADAAGRTP